MSAAGQDTILYQSTRATFIALSFSAVHISGKNPVLLQTAPCGRWMFLEDRNSVVYRVVHLQPEVVICQGTFRCGTEENRGFLSLQASSSPTSPWLATPRQRSGPARTSQADYGNQSGWMLAATPLLGRGIGRGLARLATVHP